MGKLSKVLMAAVVTAGVGAQGVETAEAGSRHHKPHHYHHHHKKHRKSHRSNNDSGALAAGIIFGAIVGAMISHAARNNNADKFCVEGDTDDLIRELNRAADKKGKVLPPTVQVREYNNGVTCTNYDVR